MIFNEPVKVKTALVQAAATKGEEKNEASQFLIDLVDEVTNKTCKENRNRSRLQT